MALDLYSGPVTRYLAKDWENAIKREAREQGYSYITVQPPVGLSVPPRPKAPTVDCRAAAVTLRLRWQAALERAGHGDTTLSWDDALDGAYATDRPGWEAYTSLMLFAAYAHGNQPAPDFAPERGWLADPAYRAALDDPECRYRQLLLPTLWLPLPEDVCVLGPSVTSEQIWLGSIRGLKDALERLNLSTFRADDLTRRMWLREEVTGSTRLEAAAQFGWAVFTQMATRATQATQPLLLSF